MKKLTVILLALTAIVSPVNFALAYGGETHPAITKEIAKFYDQQFPNKAFSENEIQILANGASEEDTFPRYLNHFYDPINGLGLDFGGHIWAASKKWAQSKDEQLASLYNYNNTLNVMTAEMRTIAMRPSQMSTSDYTWQRAIRDYAEGNTERGLAGLGHVLHLLEDATVPAHTRNDPHPSKEEVGELLGDGDPYEQWSHKFGLSNTDIVSNMGNKKPVLLPTLNDYFNEVATYTNTHFYSKDTFKNYIYPRISNEIKIDGYIFTQSEEEGERYLSAIRKFGYYENSSILTTDADQVSQSSWDRLSVKAVQYGAGVVDLFFKEVEKLRNDPNFKVTDDSSLMAKIIYSGADSVRSVGNDISSIASAISNFVSGNSGNNQIASTGYSGNVIDQFTAPVVDEPASPAPEPQEEETVVVEPETTPVVPAPVVRTAPVPILPVVAQPAPIPSTAGPTPTAPSYITVPSYSEYIQANGLGGIGGGGSSGPAVSTPDPISEPIVPVPDPILPIVEATSTPTTTPEVVVDLPPPPPPPEPATHVVISEMYIDMPGADTKEFVELYNPTNADIDISGYSLQYLSGTATSTDVAVKKNFTANAVIKSKSFYLVGLGGYTGTPTADMTWSQSLNNTGATVFLVNGHSFISGNDDTNIIDQVVYGATTLLPAEGSSIERKTIVGTECVASEGVAEFSGNTCDTNKSADFTVRAVPNPQSSQNLPEPRTAPSVISNTPSIVSYASNDPSPQFTPQLRFSWTSVSDAVGVTSTIKYKLIETTNASTAVTLVDAVGTNSFAKNIGEVGKNYSFTIQATDRDGLSSEITNTGVSVPGYFTNVKFYTTPSSSPTAYSLDLAFDQYPFIPISYPHPQLGAMPKWHAVIFYYNQMPNTSITTLNDFSGPYGWSANNVPGALMLNFNTCNGNQPYRSFITPDTEKNCDGMIGGSKSLATSWSSLSANAFKKLTLSVKSSRNPGVNPQAGVDYVTMAFYGYNPGSNDSMFLIAVDPTKRYFSLNSN